jgi:hypothetical protein
MSAVIRILIGGIAGAILGYLMHVGTFAGLGLGLFVVLWFTQRNLPHPGRPRFPLPPMPGP